MMMHATVFACILHDAVFPPACSAPVRNTLPEAEWDSGLDKESPVVDSCFESVGGDDGRAGGRQGRKKDLLKYYIGSDVKNEKSLSLWGSGTNYNNESFAQKWALSSDRQRGFRKTDSSWVQQEAKARKPVALGVWQKVTDSFSSVLTWQKLGPQGARLSRDCNFFNPCVFEGKFNLSGSDSFTLNSSKSCLLCAIWWPVS